TAAYMSPEQLRGAEVDTRSDIFSLGVLYYEMLAGRRPFEGETASHVIVAILEKEHPPLSQYAPGIPAELERIIGKALHKKVTERCPTVADLAEVLKALKQKQVLNTDPIVAQDSQGGAETATTVPPSPAHQSTQVEALSTGASATEHTATKLGRPHHQINRLKVFAAIGLAASIVAIFAATFLSNRSPILTDRDTVLLTDFANQTGDEIFDNTLKQALAVQLEQTPFLNFFPEERVRETLRYMGRTPNERVTKDLGREIGQRQGLKAVLAGSIAR